MGEEDSEKKVVWNFDDAEAKLIFEMKVDFIKHRDNWDLESAYWSLLRFLSEAEPLFNDGVRGTLNEDFDKITETRNNLNKLPDSDDGEKSSYFIMLNNFYRKICEEIVEKDFYFRKKKEYTGL